MSAPSSGTQQASSARSVASVPVFDDVDPNIPGKAPECKVHREKIKHLEAGMRFVVDDIGSPPDPSTGAEGFGLKGVVVQFLTRLDRIDNNGQRALERMDKPTSLAKTIPIGLAVAVVLVRESFAIIHELVK